MDQATTVVLEDRQRGHAAGEAPGAIAEVNAVVAVRLVVLPIRGQGPGCVIVEDVIAGPDACHEVQVEGVGVRGPLQEGHRLAAAHHVALEPLRGFDVAGADRADPRHVFDADPSSANSRLYSITS